MRPWIRRTLIGVFGASLLFGAFAAGACHRHGWSPLSEADATRLKERMVDKVAKKLDLDEAQKARFATLADRVQEQRKALAGPNGEARTELRSLVAGPAFDRAKAQALLEQKTQAVAGNGPQLVAALGDFWDSLKPEQQAKLREFMDRRHGWRG